MASDKLKLIIRHARPGDAAAAADLAAAKRAEYERYSPVFWRPAQDAREKHLPFLKHCIESDQYAGFAAELGDETGGVILAKRGAAPPPFHADPEPTYFVDDFFVTQSEQWISVGAALLDAVAADARTRGAERLIVVTAQRDTPKRAMLLDTGYSIAAAWWVHPTHPTHDAVPGLGGVNAIVAPAPPVYDPGGPVALAFSMGESPAQAVASFDQWAAASGAVLAIVPARTTDVELTTALAAQGYTVASEWFTRQV